EGEGFVAGAVVGHDTLDGDAEALVVGDGCAQEGDGAFLLFVGKDGSGRNSGVVVDGDVGELPAGPLSPASGVALAAAIAGDAMADGIEPAELFDVDMDDLARRPSLVAWSWLLRLDTREQA